MQKIVHVAVGVIMREQQYFLTKRLEHAHQGGKWEFPGGKVEKDETVAQALHRELQEEVAIDVLSCYPLIEVSHDYGDKKVLLDVYVVDNFQYEPTAQEGQQSAWFTLAQLSQLDFPAANVAIVAKLLANK
ncbi:8-oxo-dGTP diphosphatase MutT [Colwellia hornerae]|uniref:8-oxo-dGTP diphosphatase n=1 Tax=Colwellia hornerae TaxID=89402 RepID=A0A5C6QSV5_9GAMM|nr:8-oxo-dGTP diphosphatase MutT [Colwellia hornerae]TWX56933.1 8-oxo-dGTP diphosphatase MutT [Colwellia hornerae]TWX62342.1 8-oxo-dGTP diphosphatase MutT [Colwellia hornerae]TWX72326.1 8-oxo-dGTP diphosphatase MutT [Colwellia hornerae]